MSTISSKAKKNLIAAAKTALENLIQVLGAGAATRVFADAVVNERRQNFCRLNGVEQMHIGDYIDQMQGKKRPPISKIPPATDHPSLWVKGDKPFLFVSQPYKLSLDDIRQIVKHCDDLDLNAEISAGLSWHFPGKTLLVAFQPKEKTATPQEDGASHDL